MWQDRPYKGLMRQLAVDIECNQPAKTALFLPASECLCVKEALKCGVINKDTHIVAVEKDPAIAKKIRRILPTLVKSYELFNEQIQNVKLPKHLDFAFFDLCGQMTGNFALWLHRFSGQEFKDGTKVSFTFNLNMRDNQFLKELDRYSYYPSDEVVQAIGRCPQVTVDPFAKHKGSNQSCVPDTALYTLVALYGAIRNNYKVKFEKIHQYRDTLSPMIFVQVNVKKALASNRITQHVYDCIPDRSRATYQPNAKQEKMTRPDGLSPQQWAWHPDNPNGIRQAMERVNQLANKYAA